jgi:general secretion pathway protein H
MAPPVMMTLATGIWNKNHHMQGWPTTSMQARPGVVLNTSTRLRGFTLIEILVTIVIISIVLGLALLRIDVDSIDSRLKQETGRMARMMELADQQAIFQSQNIGMLILEDSYGFYVLDKDKWLAVDDALLKQQTFDEDMEIIVTIDGAEVKLDASLPEKPVPQIIFSSSGEWTAFEILFGQRDNNDITYVLNNIETGLLEIQREANAYR